MRMATIFEGKTLPSIFLLMLPIISFSVLCRPTQHIICWCVKLESFTDYRCLISTINTCLQVGQTASGPNGGHKATDAVDGAAVVPETAPNFSSAPTQPPQQPSGEPSSSGKNPDAQTGMCVHAKPRNSIS